jgi:hypothetical protein
LVFPFPLRVCWLNDGINMVLGFIRLSNLSSSGTEHIVTLTQIAADATSLLDNSKLLDVILDC